MKGFLYYAALLWLCGSLQPAYAQTVLHHGHRIPTEMRADGCLACHDGSSAKVIVYCTVLCDFSTAHSMFKPYPPLQHYNEFAPTATVRAQGIRLENGRVTCISCHDMQNPAGAHLVGKTNSENICIICHVRK